MENNTPSNEFYIEARSAKDIEEDLAKLSRWEQYKENLGESRPWHLVDPNIPKASEAEAEARYAICKVCPDFFKPTGSCKKCGCFMMLKTKLQNASCPIDKW